MTQPRRPSASPDAKATEEETKTIAYSASTMKNIQAEEKEGKRLEEIRSVCRRRAPPRDHNFRSLALPSTIVYVVRAKQCTNSVRVL